MSSLARLMRSINENQKLSQGNILGNFFYERTQIRICFLYISLLIYAFYILTLIIFSLTSLVIKYWRNSILTKRIQILLYFLSQHLKPFQKKFLAGKFCKFISNSKPIEKLKLTNGVCKVVKKKKCILTTFRKSRLKTHFSHSTWWNRKSCFSQWWTDESPKPSS